MKYCKHDNNYSKVEVTREMIKREGNFYVIDNKLVEIRCGQRVYGTVRVEGIVKERLEELINVKWDLQKTQAELDEAEEDIRYKDKAIGVMRTQLEGVYFTLGEKESSLSQALGKVQECEAEMSRRALEKATLQENAKKKIQAAEERAKRAEKELRSFKEKEKDNVAKAEEMAQEIKEAAREREELKKALSTANEKLEDAAIMTDFRRQQSIKDEQLLADKKNSFDYKVKMEQKMEDQAKFYQEQMASQEKAFLEQKDSLQKNFDDQMAAVSVTDADLKRQNEIFIMTIAKLSETVGTSKAKECEKTAEREKNEGRIVIGGCEKMEQEEEV